jgi:hypothetical protein
MFCEAFFVLRSVDKPLKTKRFYHGPSPDPSPEGFGPQGEGYGPQGEGYGPQGGAGETQSSLECHHRAATR